MDVNKEYPFSSLPLHSAFFCLSLPVLFLGYWGDKKKVNKRYFSGSSSNKIEARGVLSIFRKSSSVISTPLYKYEN
jgi:hypothetical protein